MKIWPLVLSYGAPLLVYIHLTLDYVSYGKSLINYVENGIEIMDDGTYPKKWNESLIVKLLGEGEPKPSFSVETRVGEVSGSC